MTESYYVFWTAISLIFLSVTIVLIWQLHRIVTEIGYIEENTRGLNESSG